MLAQGMAELVRAPDRCLLAQGTHRAHALAMPSSTPAVRFQKQKQLAFAHSAFHTPISV
ncbi:MULTISPECIES: hypothetical protein [Comamonas]|jgi:hypothetical protein|uniref:hypothetical protein n=1 Tax=Comamonas TaxID=283 RepID=UPI00237D4481|nr:hypothetical protein [Comamonas aquatica]